jgi:hypothetical protein
MVEFLEGRELPGVEVLRRDAPDPETLRDVPDLRPDGRATANPYARAFSPRLSLAFIA